MTEFPDNWYRDSPAAAGAPGSSGYSGPTVPGRDRNGDPAATGPVGAAPVGVGPVGPGPVGARRGGQAASQAQASAWPAQPPVRAPGGPSGPAGPPAFRQPRRKRRKLPLILGVLAVLVALAVAVSVSGYLYLNSQLTKKDVLVSYAGRPAAGAGQNWLITGSDSRQGLSQAQIRRLATGTGIAGQRSDTIMLLHLPANGGRPVLVSFPRDSYVNIPGYGWNKLNAAYAYGGPQLLARVLQNRTGLRIDHYMGIGFGGFVRVVNAIGGVRLCLKAPLDDPKAGLHLSSGCQNLNGAQALGYVRSRETFATQDLQRVQNQRVFLRALLRKLTSTSVLINPFETWPAATGVTGNLTVDQGTSLYQLLHVAFALRNPVTTTVPVSNPNYLTSTVGDVLLWNDAQARQLFTDLRTDQAVPKSLISGSHQAG